VHRPESSNALCTQVNW